MNDEVVVATPALNQSDRSALHSAETYVQEPGDLWTAGLPKHLRDQAFRLDSDGSSEAYVWMNADDRPLRRLETTRRHSREGTTSASLLAMMDREGIAGAVLYPPVATRAYAECPDGAVLDAFLEVYNDWILDLAARAPDRLKAAALLNVDEPEAAVRVMRRLAERGAAGFVLPVSPGEGHRYDQPHYEVLWRATAELGRPLSLLSGAGRRTKAKTAEEEWTPVPTPAARLAFRATSVFPARRAVTAIIYAGVFERYPALRIGVVGFGAGWAAYAMVRADEMYEVRPERTGPPTRVTRDFDERDAVRHLKGEAGVAIASDDRSGTRGMAPEGAGYNFPPGETFSDHFRRNVFLTFDEDVLGVSMRGFIGVDGMLWAHRLGALHSGKSVRHRLDKLLDRVPASERHRLVSTNTARLYGFADAAGP